MNQFEKEIHIEQERITFVLEINKDLDDIMEKLESYITDEFLASMVSLEQEKETES